MKFLYTLFLLVCLAIAAVAGLSGVVTASATQEAFQFLDIVQSGDLTRTSSSFGNNGCDCVPKGGYISFLQYQSGHEPNLAFLIGHPFSTAHLTTTPMKDQTPYLIPWQHPESTDVEVRLDFSKGYQPYFLPLDMAYGLPMTETELNEFIERPGKDLRDLCLRLRPSLHSGLIPRQDLNAQEKLLPAQIRMHLRPADAGPVLKEGKTQLTDSQIVSRLPRLQSIVIKLHAVRRGIIFPWMIKNFDFSDPHFSPRK